MKNEIQLKFFLGFCFSFFIFHFSYSLTNADTVIAKKPSTMNDTWFHSSEPEKHYVIDSTIYHLEEYNLVQRNGREYMHTGNMGAPAYPMVYDINRSMGFNAGYNQFDLYRYTKDSVKYYQVIRPYAELSMILGLNNEQMFQGKFANQHKGVLFYGIDFTRIFSKGTYANQRTNDNGLNFYGIYNSKNKHWNVQADLIFNSFKVQENGGVAADPFIDTVNATNYFKKELVPVNITGLNTYSQIDFYLTGSYSIGKKYFERKDDTTRVQTLLPVFKVSYQFNVEKDAFKYKDYTPDSLFYGAYYLPDSVYNTLKYHRIGDKVMLEYRPRKLTSDSTYTEKDFIASAEAGFDYFLLNQNNVKNNFGNLYVGATIRNNYASKGRVIYRATGKYFLYGWNQNDFQIDGTVGYNFGKFGTLTGNATYQMKEAPYIFERYDYVPVSWNYTSKAAQLPKTIIWNVGGKYTLPFGITADFNYYLADHIPVYPGLSNPYITTKPENIFVSHIGNRNQVVGIHFDNDIWYSVMPNVGYLKSNFPVIYTKHSLYYSTRVFKKVLWFAVGFDVRFRYTNKSGNNPPYYEPLLGQFYPGSNPSADVRKTFPVADFFLNFKIKTVRIFLKVDNLTSVLGPKGYYSFNGYPAPDVSFHGGVRWRFFE